MNFLSHALFIGLLLILMGGKPLNAMEIIFGKKYPIQQNSNKDQLSWTSIEFEKDVTGKVIYKLTATHPKGKKISYLKGKDYLLSEEIQRSMVRNFEVKFPDAEFDSNHRVSYELVLPYDFQTRYLPLKFETEDGYQDVVLRLRFGDYRFMLASKILNTVYNAENVSIANAKTVEQLFASRAQLKKRPDKVVEKQEVAAVNVDDIYGVISKDLNIKSRIVTDVSQVAEAEPEEQVMDEFDSVLSQYLPSEKEAKSVSEVKNVIPRPTEKSRDISYELSQVDQDVIANPTTEKDYNAYVENLIKDNEKPEEFNEDATVDDIINQAGRFEKQAREEAINKKILNIEEEKLEQFLSSVNGEEPQETEEDMEAQKIPPPKQQVYVPPVDTEELFGLPSDGWVEPKSAPILVIKPQPVNQKRRMASFEAPKRNNFVEMTPAPKAAPPAGNMDDLFGGSSEANSSGFGF